jgi:D-alanyl-lipoteichoic acid acyltransferase DltB (MBOAT superfamily)
LVFASPLFLFLPATIAAYFVLPLRYRDMAIGLMRMFGFRILENFNYPYIARSIREFWLRWHISLSNRFRDYVYVPLGGNRAGTRRAYANLIIVFLLCGLWHGASWPFVLWGAWHGLFLIVERAGISRVRAAPLRCARLHARRRHGWLGPLPLRQPRACARVLPRARRIFVRRSGAAPAPVSTSTAYCWRRLP